MTDITIPLIDPRSAKALALKYCDGGFHRIKIKVGDDCKRSRRRVRAVHEAFVESGKANHLEIAMDANEGFSSTDAIALMRYLYQLRIPVKIFEQPVPRQDRQGLKYVTDDARGWDVKVIADESVFTKEDAHRLADKNVVHGFNLKLMKHGGLMAAKAIAHIAHQHGLLLMVGGMVETRLAMTAALHLAMAIGDVWWLDLDTPLLLNDSLFVGGIRYLGPQMELPEETGIGVSSQK